MFTINIETIGMAYFDYDRHQNEWQRCLDDPARRVVAETWNRNDSVDAWRRERFHNQLMPFLGEETWLTVGDGRFGSDAQFLLRHGQSVHCSDISDTLLKEAHKRGLINEFSAQNAEALTFADGSFDYVYCKESFHHFPRPYIALTEMFRVARKAVILTEPRDFQIDRRAFSWVLDIARKACGQSERHDFEDVGNYVYRISEREIEKFALGMHYRHVAFRSANDAYFTGLENAARQGREHSKLKRKLAVLDLLDKLHLRSKSMLTAVIFKQPPKVDLVGWDYRVLPRNPYLECSNSPQDGSSDGAINDREGGVGLY